MSNRDFIDDDLVHPRPGPERVDLGTASAAPRAAAGAAAEGASHPPVTELDLPALSRHKKKIDEQSAVTVEELEKLQRMEEELKRQKRELEEARRKHDDYVSGKEELLARISQSLVSIERHEIRAEQTAQILKTTRLRFREILEGIRELRDDEWPEDEMRDRLNEALATLEDARMEYNKSTARIESVLGGEDAEGGGRPVIFDDTIGSEHERDRRFLDWVWIGLAVSLPLLLVLGALGIFLVLHLLTLI